MPDFDRNHDLEPHRKSCTGKLYEAQPLIAIELKFNYQKGGGTRHFQPIHGQPDVVLSRASSQKLVFLHAFIRDGLHLLFFFVK
jgi:hypothetical protein